MQGKSSLNADAAPYVPLSKNSAGNNDASTKAVSVSEKSADVGDAVGCLLPDNVFLGQSLAKPHISDEASSERSIIHNSDAENQSMMDDRNMAIDLMMNSFSDYSEKSITELLDFCEGDVVTAMDMLEHLENEGTESPGASGMQYGEGSASPKSKSSWSASSN